MNQTGFVCYSCSVLTDLIGLACSPTLYFLLSKRKRKHRLCTGYHRPWIVYKTLRQLVRGVFFPNTFEVWLNTRRKLTVYRKKEEEEALGRTNFWTGEFLTCANRLHGTVQILFQIAVLFSRVHTNVCIVLLLELLKTCAVSPVPCKRKADPCKFLSVQKFVRTRFIRRLSLLHFRCRWVRLEPPKGPWSPLAITEVRVIKAVKSRY